MIRHASGHNPLKVTELLAGICCVTNINAQCYLGRLLRPDIVHFHFTCLGTEIFLRELTLSSTLSSNPKSSRIVDLKYFHKLLFYLHKFYDKFFHCSTTQVNEDIHDYVTQKDQFLLTSLPFNKRPFCRIISSYLILCVLDV